jgi:5'-3' exonuclease
MNDSGELNMPRFEAYLAELSKFDYDRFEKEADSSRQLHKLRPTTSELDKDQLPNAGFSAQILQKLMISAPINPPKETNGKNEMDVNEQLIDNFIAQERKSPNNFSSSSSEDVQPAVYPDADDDGPSSDSDRLSDHD